MKHSFIVIFLCVTGFAVNAQNVGIGTENPDSTLHVVGGLKLDLAGKGEAKVLTSDSTGGATWRDFIVYSTPNTIDQVLRTGSITRQKLIWDDSSTVSGSGLTNLEIRPSNYLTPYTIGTAQRFTQGYTIYPGVNSSGRPNMVGLLWGYNGGFNTATTAGEPTWGVRTETWFEMGGGIGHSEFHGVSPEFKAINGESRRLGTYYVNNLNGYTAYNSQIDVMNIFQGRTDTAMLAVSPAATKIGFNTNGSLQIINQRANTNLFSASLNGSGVVFNTGGVNPAATYFTFNSPINVSMSATVGVNNKTAVNANVNTAASSAYKVSQVGLTGESFAGLSAQISTTETFDIVTARNLAVGTLRSFLQIGTGGTAAYALGDASGTIWNVSYTGGEVGKPLKIGVGEDSAIKIRSDNGAAIFKYKLAIGTADASARLTLPGGSAIAQTAPLKFTAGLNLATAEDGAVEFDGTNYFVTAAGKRYTLAKTLTGTAALDFPPTAPGAPTDLTVTVTGAMPGDVVDIGIPGNSVTATAQFTGWVSAADTVTIRCHTQEAEDPASGIFRAVITDY